MAAQTLGKMITVILLIGENKGACSSESIFSREFQIFVLDGVKHSTNSTYDDGDNEENDDIIDIDIDIIDTRGLLLWVTSGTLW